MRRGFDLPTLPHMKVSTRLFAQVPLAVLTPVMVMVACVWQLADIRYTLNGSSPVRLPHQPTAANRCSLSWPRPDPAKKSDTVALLTRTKAPR